jgi:hypothetical protein
MTLYLINQLQTDLKGHCDYHLYKNGKKREKDKDENEWTRRRERIKGKIDRRKVI